MTRNILAKMPRAVFGPYGLPFSVASSIICLGSLVYTLVNMDTMSVNISLLIMTACGGLGLANLAMIAVFIYWCHALWRYSQRITIPFAELVDGYVDARAKYWHNFRVLKPSTWSPAEYKVEVNPANTRSSDA